MKNKFTLNIPNPCSADWNQMNSSDKGRFCLACQTTVIDFSGLDDTAIKDYFQNYSGKVCGRFQKNQLKEYSLPVRRRSFYTFLATIGLTSLITPVSGFSKSPPNFIQTITKAGPILPVIKKQLPKGDSTVYTVTGKIVDKEDNQPIPGVTILLKETNIGTVSQADGSFKLQINYTYLEKATLTFSFIGYQTLEKEILFANSSAIEIQEINLKMDAKMLGGLVVVGQVGNTWYNPRNLWWRFKSLFH